LIGSAVIRGRATEIVDVTQYLPAASTGVSARGGPGSGRTVLLVESSPFVREMLAAVVRAAGYHVIAPERPEEALASAERAGRIDAVVADLEGAGQGAGNNGFALVEAIRKHPLLGQVPVIAIASTVSRDAVDRARNLGVIDFVQKFDRAGLVSALAEIVSPAFEEAA
jgi:two-component system chemotaxis sensor kinase CheA